MQQAMGWIAELVTTPLDAARPVRSLLRIYLFANLMALAIALGIGGPGPAASAAQAAFSWCRIG